MATDKFRLDVLLVNRGYFKSRDRAQAAVMEGHVLADGIVALKPGTSFPESVQLEVKEKDLQYVSRGGLKLEKALDEFGIDPAGRVCMDIGASTGGFTDVLLTRGAGLVYAIDVGYGQLDWTLRNDPRVVNLERTNIRYIDKALIKTAPSFICIDVSFISLSLVLPVAAGLLERGGEMVALIKPQFEAGRGQVGKGGIIRDGSVRAEVIDKVRGYAESCGLRPGELIESPISGAKGNIEYLIHLRGEAVQ